MLSYTIDELMARLGCEKFPERWREIYADAVRIYENGENPLLRPTYYDELQKSYRVFENTLDIYKKAAELLAAREEAALFFCILCRALRDRGTIQRDIAQMQIPPTPEGADPLPYDMMTALSLCQSYDAFYEKMRAHNVPDDILYESMKIPEKCVELHIDRPRLTSFDWYQHAYDGKLYRIGRLQLEFPMGMPHLYCVFENKNGEIVALANQRVHRDGFALGSRNYTDEEGAFTATVEETDDAYIGYPFDERGHVRLEKVTLPKAEWSVKLKCGDLLVGLHIPKGKGFEDEAVEETLRRSKEFLKNCYPEYAYKAFFCGSWLLDPTLVEILGENANISKFCKRFIPFGVRSAGISPFGYVFQKHGNDVKIEEFDENTSLQRALKKHYLEGKAIYDMHGVFFD